VNYIAAKMSCQRYVKCIVISRYMCTRFSFICINTVGDLGCQNEGFAQELEGRWSCLCEEGFTGEYCEERE